MADHPFAGFDGLIAKAAAILQEVGPPSDWRVQNRVWFAQQILVTNDLMLAAIAAGDARKAALWGIRLGGLIRGAGPPDLDPPRGRGGRARAAAKDEQRAAWQREAEMLRAEHPGWNKSQLAKRIDPARWERVRKVI